MACREKRRIVVRLCRAARVSWENAFPGIPKLLPGATMHLNAVMKPAARLAVTQARSAFWRTLRRFSAFHE
jgi:hypothetical protein